MRRRPIHRLMFILPLGLLLGAASVSAQPDQRYWRLDAVRAQLDAWESAHPDLVHQTTLGPSGLGEPIPIVRISDNAGQPEPEPRLLFHAAQHANECNGTGAVMATIAMLLGGYGLEPGMTARVDGLELWFAPITNVDGHRYVFDALPHWQDWRKTLRDNDGDEVADFPGDGVDTNRNWDWRWAECDDDYPTSQKYKGPSPFSEPEVVALRDFVLAERPLLVVDYHSPVSIGWSNTIFYPWLSTAGNDCPDYDVSRDVAQDWAAATRTETNSTYSSIFAYDTLPKEQCWVYGNAGILAYVMEISDQNWWTGATVDTIAARVARGSLTLMDRALGGPGLRGRVTDALTGLPLVAEVRIDQMHSSDIGPRLSEASHGAYFRLTESGNYTVRAMKTGYDEQSRQVTVGAGGWTDADFALAPTLTAAPAVAAAGSWFRFAAPLRAGEALQLVLPSAAGPASVDLLDVRGRAIARLASGLAPGRSHAIAVPEGLAAGVYLLRARGLRENSAARLVYLP